MTAADDYLQEQDKFLEYVELQLMETLQPLLDRLEDEVAELVDGLPSDPVKRQVAVDALLEDDGPLERLLGPINDRLQVELGRLLEQSTPDIRRHAAGVLPGARVDMPMLDARTLLGMYEIEPGVTIAEHLRRESPSDWMRSLARRFRNLVTASVGTPPAGGGAGIGKALRETINSAARVVVSTIAWAHSSRVQQTVWSTVPAAVAPRGFRWVTSRYEAEKTCGQCRPLDGQVRATVSEFPQIPLHPRCRCGLWPVR